MIKKRTFCKVNIKEAIKTGGWGSYVIIPEVKSDCWAEGTNLSQALETVG